MKPDIENLKQLIIHNLDIIDFLDILNMDISDLVDLVEDEIKENYISLVKAVT